MADVSIKRVYEGASSSDGQRVLVDRLWPRGISKDKASVDTWLKEVGPSNELRKWFNHDPAKYVEFKRRYEKELASSEAFKNLQKIASQKSKLTLVYSAKDTEHNQATVLLGMLTG